MNKGLDLDIFLTGFFDQIQGRFPCQDNSGKTEFPGVSDALQIMDMHLGRTVQFKIRILLFQIVIKAKVLYQQGINLVLVIEIRHFNGVGKFLLRQKRI